MDTRYLWTTAKMFASTLVNKRPYTDDARRLPFTATRYWTRRNLHKLFHCYAATLQTGLIMIHVHYSKDNLCLHLNIDMLQSLTNSRIIIMPNSINSCAIHYYYANENHKKDVPHTKLIHDKGKDAVYSEWNLGGVLIFLSQAIEPVYVDIPLSM